MSGSNYIFPDYVGKLMAKTSIRFQYESSMMSLTVLMIFTLITASYIILFSNFGLFYKIMTGLNGFFGVLFLYSNLLTTFQQYRTYIEIENLKGGVK